jgi:hypothetical protein
MAVAQRIYAEALFGAAKDADRLEPVHEAFGDFAARYGRVAGAPGRPPQPAARVEREVRDPRRPRGGDERC